MVMVLYYSKVSAQSRVFEELFLWCLAFLITYILVNKTTQRHRTMYMPLYSYKTSLYCSPYIITIYYH